MTPTSARNRTLLHLGIAAMLLSPAAWAASPAQDGAQSSPPPASPTQAQGPERAAEHSSVVQRDLWTRLDTNRDNRISTSEAAADTDFDATFTAMDMDEDGFVTEGEYRARPGAPTTGPTTGATRASEKADLAGLDADGDGTISREESAADAALQAGFSSADADGDGRVSSREYRDWTRSQRK